MYVKTKRDRAHSIFTARDLIGANATSGKRDVDDDEDILDRLHRIAHFAINRVVFLGRMLDEAQQAAYVDSTYGLPNMRAAMLKMEQALKSALSLLQPFSILLMDGYNLSQYNNISYAVGDEMIRKMSALL